jgi:transcription termination factor NusB
VAIDEAIRIAQKFSTAESGAFVNGILDRVMARARPAGAAEGKKK